MDFAYSRCAALLLLAATIALPPSAAAVGGAFFVKGGGMRLQNDSQAFDTPQHVLVNADLNGSSYKAIDLGWELRFRQGWTVGAEYLGYDHRFTSSATPSATGLALTDAFMVNAKRYFINGGRFHPYAGGGIGVALTDISNNRSGGAIDDINVSLLAHAMLGIELRFDNLSLMLETKTLYYDNRKSDVEYNPSATGVLLGAGFNW